MAGQTLRTAQAQYKFHDADKVHDTELFGLHINPIPSIQDPKYPIYSN